MTILFFHSGGGVTISGGEVFLQADFAQKILKSCIEQRIKENLIRLNKEFKEEYRKLGRVYGMKGIKKPAEQEMEDMAAVLKKCFRNVRLRSKEIFIKNRRKCHDLY